MSNEAINVYQQYLDNNGESLSAGTLTFYENNTTTLATIYSDSDLTIPQINPYTLDSLGRINGDVHFNATLTIQVNDMNGAFIRSIDNQISLQNPISESDLTQIQENAALPWNIDLTYRKGVTVIDSTDNNYYMSLIDNNIGLIPNANPTEWRLVPQVYGDVFSTELVDNDTSSSTTLAPTANIIRSLGEEIDTNTTNITDLQNNIATVEDLQDGIGSAFTIGSIFGDNVNTGTQNITLWNGGTNVIGVLTGGSFKIGGITFNFGHITYTPTNNIYGTITLSSYSFFLPMSNTDYIVLLEPADNDPSILGTSKCSSTESGIGRSQLSFSFLSSGQSTSGNFDTSATSFLQIGFE